jgi:hypothetical protein
MEQQYGLTAVPQNQSGLAVKEIGWVEAHSNRDTLEG